MIQGFVHTKCHGSDTPRSAQCKFKNVQKQLQDRSLRIKLIQEEKKDEGTHRLSHLHLFPLCA